MRAIVTGGAGFIGSNLALELERDGAETVVVDDFSAGHFENLKGFHGEIIAISVNKIDWQRLPKPNVFFHQAALTDTTVADQKKMMYNNVEGFRKVLEYTASNRIPLVYASSAGVYGNEPAPQREDGPLNPLNIYAYSKLIGDQMATRAMKEAKSLIVGLRYFNVFGLGEKHKAKYASMVFQLAEQMRSGKRPRIFFDGEQTRDHIDVRDVVHANLKAVQAKTGGIVNIGTGKQTSFNRLIQIINDTLGTHHEPEYFDNPYDFYQNHTQADISRAQKLFGFECRYGVETGVHDYLTALYGLKQKNRASARV